MSTQDPAEFVNQFQRVMTAYNITNEKRFFFQLILLCLEGGDLHWFDKWKDQQRPPLMTVKETSFLFLM